MSAQGHAAYGMRGEKQLSGQPPEQAAGVESQQAAPEAGAGLVVGLAGAGGVAAAGAASSNYDFVKIKVRLGTQLEHYYILSRFLLSRMLTVITLPQHKVRGRPGVGRGAECMPVCFRCSINAGPSSDPWLRVSITTPAWFPAGFAGRLGPAPVCLAVYMHSPPVASLCAGGARSARCEEASGRPRSAGHHAGR